MKAAVVVDCSIADTCDSDEVAVAEKGYILGRSTILENPVADAAVSVAGSFAGQAGCLYETSVRSYLLPR
jgi:hypothetical protein